MTNKTDKLDKNLFEKYNDIDNSSNDTKDINPLNYISLIGKIIKKHSINISCPYYEDLVQSGLLGVIRAKENYDSNKSSFVTIAYFYIRSEIQHEIARQNNFSTYDTYLRHKPINIPIDLINNDHPKYLKYLEDIDSIKDFNIDKKVVINKVNKILNKYLTKEEIKLILEYYDEYKGYKLKNNKIVKSDMKSKRKIWHINYKINRDFCKRQFEELIK